MLKELFMTNCLPTEKKTKSYPTINRVFVLCTGLSRLFLRARRLGHMVSSKLSNCGNGNAYQWLRSYLENRTQICLINGSLSNSCPVNCGVPPRAILRPLLFLPYVN